MSVDVPDNIPRVFSAGETTKFRRFVPDYLPADGWTLSLHLNGALATLHKTAVADGDAYLVTIDPTDTVTLNNVSLSVLKTAAAADIHFA